MDAYIRVSRVAGREGESFQSPGKQRDEIAAWAALRGVEIGKWHEPELDVSGKKASRPILDEAMARVEAGESDGIVVAKLSRFGRSVTDGLKLVKRIHDAGGKFAAIDLGIDPTTSTGKLVLTFFLALAEWEHDRLSEEWEAVRKRAHEDGAYLAPAPIGYTKTKRSRLRRDPATWRPVREVFRMRARDVTLVALADYLRESGVTVSKSGVREILRNRAYIGEAMGRPDSHEPIVSMEEWDAVQSRRGAKPIHDGTIAAKGMLTRIIRCAGCGQRISVGGGRKRTDGERSGRYFCRGDSTAGRCPAPAAAMLTKVDDFVRESITTALADGTLKATQDAIRAYTRARNAVDQAQEAIDFHAANAARLMSSLGGEGYAAAGDDLRAVLDAARAVLADTPAPDSVIEPDSLLWDKWDIEDERAFARQVISEVRLRAGGKGRYGPPIHERIEIRWAGHDDFDTTVYARGAEARETAARLRAA
jgi:DNA invertase Pin-like site-specific DNA recombinase